MFDVMCKIWDPILGKYGNQEERVNVEPLTEQEADAMIADLGASCDPEYRGQGQAMLSVRKVATFQAATKLYVTMRGILYASWPRRSFAALEDAIASGRATRRAFDVQDERGVVVWSWSE